MITLPQSMQAIEEANWRAIHQNTEQNCGNTIHDQRTPLLPESTPSMKVLQDLPIA